MLKRCGYLLILSAFSSQALFANEISKPVQIEKINHQIVAGLPPVVPRNSSEEATTPEVSFEDCSGPNPTGSSCEGKAVDRGNDTVLGGYEFKFAPPPISPQEAKTDRFLQGGFILVTALLFTAGFIATKVNSGHSVYFEEKKKEGA